MVTTALSARPRAASTSDRWPACSAPMVGTRPMRCPASRHAAIRPRNSTMVATISGVFMSRNISAATPVPLGSRRDLGIRSDMTFSPLRQAVSGVYLADENKIAAERIGQARLSPAEEAATHKLARDLVMRIRKEGARGGGVDAFMQEYSLSGPEGVALMCLAEAL